MSHAMATAKVGLKAALWDIWDIWDIWDLWDNYTSALPIKPSTITPACRFQNRFHRLPAYIIGQPPPANTLCSWPSVSRLTWDLGHLDLDEGGSPLASH